MTYHFPPAIESLIRKQMRTGNFQSEDELLLAALRALDQVRDDLAAIEAGLADVRAGQVAADRSVSVVY